MAIYFILYFYVKLYKVSDFSVYLNVVKIVNSLNVLSFSSSSTSTSSALRTAKLACQLYKAHLIL